jgi:prephenate dehydrogenase
VPEQGGLSGQEEVMKRVGIIGVGNMGESIVRALLGAGI